ncbi:MAG TPA: hypothetical protein VLX28_11520 [Thermoanaerobaculia bacterium]|nr:hypothetical protein [Thermoanaerobaculia bacterium]
MKNNLGMLFGSIYVVGFLAVQVHLLRFGILEISPLQAYYFIVGLWFLLCISPAIAVILAAEYLVSSYDSQRGRLIVLIAGGSLSITTIASIARFSAPGTILNFNTYPYPSWYLFWNFALMNVSLILVWVLCFLGARHASFRRVMQKVAAIAATVMLADSVVFFGRTIYPALDRGIGGGSSQFTVVTCRDGKSFFALQVYAREKSLYLLELSALPAQFASRSARTQFVADSKGPVYKALADNQVIRMGNDQVSNVRILGLSQKAELDRYLKK